MSYSVKNDKNKIALKLAISVLLNEQLSKQIHRQYDYSQLTVSNELYYILINNSMIKEKN